ncbi:MAG: glucose-6-phosphate dehydrogenase [Candidatus Aminicenantes bacterium]|nr:glucose-6-phosphate dehydrogenase [Candidatus Aminicenantes bacterium]
MMEPPVDRHLFVILGGTGNLTYLKLLPALYRLLTQKNLKDYCQVLGVGTKELGDQGFRNRAREALQEAGFSSEEVGIWCDSCLHYQSLGKTSEDYSDLASRVESLEAEHDIPGNRVFYLALPPSIFPTAIQRIGESGLNKSSGWVRIVIEKPFGRDLASAQELNRLLHRNFDESQIYRIDHYLGKETVQNLLIFRFANTIFESLWNRERIESVQITVAESIGIGERARYYEQAGALRDIVQNHLVQLLCLVAMEPPAVFEADFIRDEKVKVLRSIAGIRLKEVVFGQYAKGKIKNKEFQGYREEKGVARDSSTETYVALKVDIDNWRWKGIPFYLRTGKRLPRRLTQIAVNFRHPPVFIFSSHTSSEIPSDRLLITLQPDEGFHLYFDVKEPGEPLKLKKESLHFHYKDAFGPLPAAYETLILDILQGEQTLFVRADEAEASWELFTPLLERDFPVYSYPVGTWGPKEADQLIEQEKTTWKNP